MSQNITNMIIDNTVPTKGRASLVQSKVHRSALSSLATTITSITTTIVILVNLGACLDGLGAVQERSTDLDENPVTRGRDGGSVGARKHFSN